MNSDSKDYAHLYLGLTRKELKRRLDLGQIDLQLLQAQLDQYSHDIKLEALSEKWIELKALDQVDKFQSTE